MVPECTIVTTCMGRLAHLKRTLPGWLAASDWRVVVVDYSCPDGAAEWASELGDRVLPIRVLAAAEDAGRPVFNLNRARHAGALRVGTEWSAFVDADVMLAPAFFAWAAPKMRPGRMLLSTAAPGLFAVRTADYLASGGYDLGRTGYGPEEFELRVRMRLMMGLDPGFCGVGVSPIPHGASERMRNYGARKVDVGASARRMEHLLVERFGFSLREAARRDPMVLHLIGARDRSSLAPR